ncbi:MAG: carotenoid biosynthesis protein [Cyclobacteriaceae bacterium]
MQNLFKKTTLTSKNKKFQAKIVIVVLHLVGIIGLSWDFSRPLFQWMTPFHLLITTGILLAFHRDWNPKFWLFVFLAFILGMVAEIIGVNTGMVFGSYHYGKALGVQVFGVPLMIGVNWFLLVYLTGGVFDRIIRNDLLAAFAGAILMVLMDLNMEPVAVKLDFWKWEHQEIPISNYLGWLMTAFLIQLIYRKSKFIKSNPLNSLILVNLIAFFLFLSLIL